MSEGIQFIRSISHGLSYLHTEVPGVNSHCCKLGEGGGSCRVFSVNNLLNLDKPGIAHRDIKSRNVLIKNDMTCAIADLGLAVRNIHGMLDVPEIGRGGTIRYLAPEYLSDEAMCNKFVSFVNMDIYALGLVIWEITRRIDTSCGKPPPQAQLPYYEFVDRNPTIDDMKQIVCAKKSRPGSLKEWEDNKVSL